MAQKIFCLGDIHLGRSPSKLPADSTSLGTFSPAEALNRSVNLALEHQVDVFAFTGDVVDSSNALFEAYSPLASAVKSLLNSNISVVAVAGNHDFDVLPRLAKELPDFKLLGADGSWEQLIIEENNAPAIKFLGKSFISQHCADNPLKDFPSDSDSLPTVVLMHCDLDSPGSNFAPVPLEELKTKEPIAWLLGHIHKPWLIQQSPLILYPGSLQGLDPSETGPHGPWMFELENGSIVNSEHFSVAPLRYQEIHISLEEVKGIEDAKGQILKTLQEWHGHNLEMLANTQAIGCRLVLEGRTEIHHLTHQLASLIIEEPPLLIGQVDFFIEKVICDSRPAADLRKLAEHSDLPGLLAKRLVVLEEREPEEEYLQLLQKAKRDLIPAHSNSSFLALELSNSLPEDTVRTALLQSGLLILDDLLRQKEIDL